MAADDLLGPTISGSASCDRPTSPSFWRTPTESWSSSEPQLTEAAVLSAGHWKKELDRFERLQFLRRDPCKLNLEFQDLRPLLERSFELEKEMVAQDQSIGAEVHVECRGLVPDRETCDRLVEFYITTFESVIRIVHIPSFLQDCRRYWQDPQSVSDCVVWKLLLVMAVGVFVSPSSTALQSHAAAWITGGHRWLARRSFECTNFDLETLQISCLLVVNNQISQIGGETVGMLKETLICMAMKLGLHQEPSTHFPAMAANEAEIRRRLWATILEIAIQSSFDSGLPPLISSEGYDCTAPSNLDDADLLGNEELVPQPLTVFTRSMVPMLLANTQRIRLRILHLVNAPGTTLPYQCVLKLTKELHDVNNTNLARMQSLAASSTGATDFHIKILDIFTRRFLLALHAPFASQAKDNPCYYYSRKVRMEAATLLLSHPLPQIEGGAPLPVADDHYAQLLLLGDGVFINALRHAASTLCLDLIDSVTENDFPVTDRDCYNHSYELVQEAISVLEQRAHRNPSAHKDYVFFSCAAAQIHAMREKGHVDRAIHEAAKQSLDHCCATLEQTVGGGNSQCKLTSLPLSPSSSEDSCLFPMSTDEADFGFWNSLIARQQFTV
jgi:hypothetical protein